MFARSRREMLTPIETATTAIGSASTNRADVFDFPHQHRGQSPHGGKRCDDSRPSCGGMHSGIGRQCARLPPEAAQPAAFRALA